jgi:TRAP-type C4-dicarboxylate transport system permease small subunit
VSIGKSIDSVHFPIAIFSVIIPLAFGLTVIRLLQRLFTDLRTFGTDRTPGEDRVRETL